MAVISEFLVRPAECSDREYLSNLIFDELSTVHRHLDWRTPLDWIGFPPYFLIEQKGKIEAVLACPADPPGVAWVRVFACSNTNLALDDWDILWKHVLKYFEAQTGIRICVITMQDWFKSILERSQFQPHQQILMLTWTGSSFPKVETPAGIILRKMELADIPRVASLDNTAFEMIWKNSEITLNKAFGQASEVTVVETGKEIIGYQLSTINITGGHLARLAVLPEFQGRGIGKFLVMNLIERFSNRGINTITVNTQSDNNASLSLYKGLGFYETGEKFPVYDFKVN